MRSTVIALATMSLLIGVPAASAQTLHLILATDSEDARLGQGFVNNAKQASSLMANIVKKSAQFKTLNTIEIKGQDYYCDRFSSKIDAAINKVADSIASRTNAQGESDDIVVFFNSGHGTTSKRGETDTNPSPFPALQCNPTQSPQDENAKVNIRLADIAAKLKDTKARMSIAVADSCNEFIPKARQAATAGRAPELPIAQLRALYRDFKGSLVMAASMPGELAYYFYQEDTRKDGYGFFTEQFKKAHTDPMPDDPTMYNKLWDDVVEKSKAPINIVAKGFDPADKGFFDKDGNMLKKSLGKEILQHPIAENNLVYIGKPAMVAAATRGIALTAGSAVKKLRNGDEGAEVKALKKALIEKGYTSLAKDASFDDDTEDAVRDFQKKSGLKVDGVAGAQTRAMLGI